MQHHYNEIRKTQPAVQYEIVTVTIITDVFIAHSVAGDLFVWQYTHVS